MKFYKKSWETFQEILIKKFQKEILMEFLEKNPCSEISIWILTTRFIRPNDFIFSE